jgi:hypothetical protein
MRETKGNVDCVFVFAKNPQEAISTAGRSIKALPNPLPTGDYWRVIEWVTDFIKLGPHTLTKQSPHRRSFIRAAAENFLAGRGICIEIASMKAREFRDSHGLRMQRGKVYGLFFRRVEEVVSQPDPLP